MQLRFCAVDYESAYQTPAFERSADGQLPSAMAHPFFQYRSTLGAEHETMEARSCKVLKYLLRFHPDSEEKGITQAA